MTQKTSVILVIFTCSFTLSLNKSEAQEAPQIEAVQSYAGALHESRRQSLFDTVNTSASLTLDERAAFVFFYDGIPERTRQEIASRISDINVVFQRDGRGWLKGVVPSRYTNIGGLVEDLEYNHELSVMLNHFEAALGKLTSEGVLDEAKTRDLLSNNNDIISAMNEWNAASGARAGNVWSDIGAGIISVTEDALASGAWLASTTKVLVPGLGAADKQALERATQFYGNVKAVSLFAKMMRDESFRPQPSELVNALSEIEGMKDFGAVAGIITNARKAKELNDKVAGLEGAISALNSPVAIKSVEVSLAILTSQRNVAVAGLLSEILNLAPDNPFTGLVNSISKFTAMNIESNYVRDLHFLGNEVEKANRQAAAAERFVSAVQSSNFVDSLAAQVSPRTELDAEEITESGLVVNTDISLPEPTDANTLRTGSNVNLERSSEIVAPSLSEREAPRDRGWADEFRHRADQVRQQNEAEERTRQENERLERERERALAEQRERELAEQREREAEERARQENEQRERDLAEQRERELAEQRERQAELERQRIEAEREARVTDLITERDAQFRLKLDAEGRITNNNNRLTILRFEERERIMQVYPTVVSEAERLRVAQRTSGLNDADAARFRNLVAYQEALEGELDRIRIEENNLTDRNTEFSAAISDAEIILAQNRLALLRDGFDVDQRYQIPRVSVVIVDWSNYEYELPPFDPTADVSEIVLSGRIMGSDEANGSGYRYAFFEGRPSEIQVGSQLFQGSSSVPNTYDKGISYSVSEVFENEELSSSIASWGRWNGSTGDADLDIYEEGFWVIGVPSSSSDLASRSGSAEFNGEIFASYVDENLFFIDRFVSGTISMTVNFGDDTISGDFQLLRYPSERPRTVVTPIYSFSADITESSRFYYTDNQFFYINGQLYGDDATEAGGEIYVEVEDEVENVIGQYQGVFRASEAGSPSIFLPPSDGLFDYENYRGLAAYIARDPDDANNPASLGFVPLDVISEYTSTVFFENTSAIGKVTTSFDSIGQEYSYTSWGSWDFTSGTLVDGVADRDGYANWLVYDPTTDLPTSGSASYQGTVDGTGSGVAGGVVRGGINLEADFGNDRITGSMNLRDGNNTSWADAAFDAPITRDTDSSGFQGALTGTNVGSGAIFGGFAGPNAEEVGGGWQINHVNGSDANGIFRAQQ